MAQGENQVNHPLTRVVGSFGSLRDLEKSAASKVRESCDLAEVRLDLLCSVEKKLPASPWHHLSEFPLLFTARRADEGGALPLTSAERIELLRSVLHDAAWIDLEVASISEMSGFIAELADRQIPWIASYHDFHRLPPTAELETAAKRAKDAGAAIFKAAAQLNSPADLARLAEFQLADHGLPVSTMGMGPLAPVSRLLCAQCGSVLNYGFLGETATAPGQWDSALLKTAISQLASYPS
ncbi:MAG: type I 3-dehydroquinate dehydratase [Luteolibacter sp.]